MKNKNTDDLKIRPRCHKAYHGVPALSRKDGRIQICPDCGTREALDSIGVELTEQEKILDAIHRSMQS